MPQTTLKKIISDGQLGVDRAALDVARAFGLSWGGWCTKGCPAVNGVTDERLHLKQTKNASAPQRNIQNVEESDATLVLSMGCSSENSEHIRAISLKVGKPCKKVDLNRMPDSSGVAEWLSTNNLETLNIFGPDGASVPEAYKKSRDFLTKVIAG